jgi:methyl-accepting chemotaxis protein
MPRSKLLFGLAGSLIVVSVVAGWIAVGQLASATQRGIARTEVALASARALAADTADSATELQRVIGLVGDGLGSTGDALVATRQVSRNLRRFLDVASFVNSVDDLSASLKDAETTIANVEVDLDEASGAIEEAGPALTETVDSLKAIPGQLDLSIAEIKSSASRIGEQVWLWRLAMIAGGAALLVLLGLMADLRRAVGRMQATQP